MVTTRGTSRTAFRRSTVGASTLLLVLVAGTAWAHPAFRPRELPAGEPTEVEIVMEHDCEVQGGGTSPTILVAIQIPDAIADAEPLPQDGWATDTVRGTDGHPTEVEWSATGDRVDQPPPTLRLRVTPDTTTQTTVVPLSVYQECEEGDYLWGGQAADTPTVDLTVTPGTLPAPSPTPAPTIDEPSPSPTAAATPAPTTTTTAVPIEDDGASLTLWALIAALVVGGVAIVAARFRSR